MSKMEKLSFYKAEEMKVPLNFLGKNGYYYYFEDAKELSIIPLEETRTWIICRLNDFEKKREHVREDGLIRETEGILIPKDEMEKQGVEVRQISRYLKGKRQTKLEV